MSGIVRGLFGGRSNAETILQRFRPSGFESGGVRGTFSNNRFTVTRTPEGQSAIDRLVRSTEQHSNAIRGLTSQVRPGFGRLTESRVQALRNERQRTVGNLREELARRRVAGSSFASHEIAATEAQFAQQEDQIRAESFLQELDLTRQLIADEFSGAIDTSTKILGQLNLESSLAANASGLASQLMANNLQLQAEARASQEAGAAAFLATIIKAFA